MNQTECERVSRIAGGAHSVVWGLLGICVAAATFYDISRWLTDW